MTEHDNEATEPQAGATPAARTVPKLLQATWEAATSDPDPLSALGATRALSPLLATYESQLVKEAMAAGATWETVGSAVGVSRQAAWERFHHDMDDFRSRVRAEAHELREKHRDEMMAFRDRVRDEAMSRGRGRRRRPSR